MKETRGGEKGWYFYTIEGSGSHTQEWLIAMLCLVYLVWVCWNHPV